MSKALKLAVSLSSKLISGGSSKILGLPAGVLPSSSRAHSTLSSFAIGRKAQTHTKGCGCLACRGKHVVRYSTEVEKELSKFLAKEIKYETSKGSDKLPKISSFDVQTNGADVTLSKTFGAEKIVVKLSVNGAVDSAPLDDQPERPDEQPQVVCRPPFEVEITKGDTVLALQCVFPSADAAFDEVGSGKEGEHIEDQFEFEEVAIHSGEWKETTYSVSAATMDAELFDLLMDMLDERGINDEFIAQLVDFCTAYENKQYVSFLQSLKTFAEK